jgi:hypothetical protein
MRNASLEPSRTPAPAEVLLAAQIAFLAALEATAGKVPLSVAGVPLWSVLNSGNIAGVLQGFDPGYPASKTLQATRFLEALREGR